MRFVEAFNSLGYEVPSPRQDWSAEKNDGICITLWKKEVQWTPSPPRLDLRDRWALGKQDWVERPGHQKRKRHLSRALEEFEGWVDAVIVTGSSDEGYGSADPWKPEQRGGYKWRIDNFDPATGFFSAVAEKMKQRTN